MIWWAYVCWAEICLLFLQRPIDPQILSDYGSRKDAQSIVKARCFIVSSYHGYSLPCKSSQSLWRHMFCICLTFDIYRCSIESDGMIYISIERDWLQSVGYLTWIFPPLLRWLADILINLSAPTNVSGGSNHLLSTRHRGAAPFYRKMTGLKPGIESWLMMGLNELPSLKLT